MRKNLRLFVGAFVVVGLAATQMGGCHNDDDEVQPPASGQLFTDFGTGGVVVSAGTLAEPEAVINGMAVDDNYIYAVGYVKPFETSGDTQWRIEKRSTKDGTLDAAFGSGGVVAVNPSAFDDRANAIAIDSTHMYVVGFDSTNAGDAQQWRIEKRTLNTGQLQGTVVSAFAAAESNQAAAIAISGGAMFVAGWDTGTTNAQWRIEKRTLDTGARFDGITVTPAFDGDGVIISNPTGGADQAKAIVTDGASIYVGGRESVSGGDWRLRIEKYDASTGAAVSGFGTSGVVQSNPSSGDDAFNAMVLDSSALYIGCTQRVSGLDFSWRVEKRGLTNGGLFNGTSNSPAFDTDGILTIAPSTGFDALQDLARDGDAVYLIGYEVVTIGGNNWQWRIEKRHAASGVLFDGTAASPAFGSTGIVTSNPSISMDAATRGVVRGSALYLCGISGNFGTSQSTTVNVDWRYEKRAK